MCSPFYSVVTFLFHRLLDLVVAHPFAFAFTLLEYICFFCLSDEEYCYEEHNGEYDGCEMKAEAKRRAKKRQAERKAKKMQAERKAKKRQAERKAKKRMR